ncbi:hypothetical protein K2173_012396 [Erythroxylum novogranatense]|uniref:Uncharacterized protein n=1 Tax=Erythroxylum novogranatense TaxID=1862640 RepID=A0AAV8U9Q7_9ROSI|nr:hypothetical protein K2173_012396 [Erythroxylum novogranatense]
MFYSQTFLARKGPLGTVWCAAHLQHRLKKSHYTSTDISSTVDRIMFPEVPIALRMSGHLLLGVVRIYSKKVDYLFHDCNVVLVGLRKAFSSIQVTLPENATTAKFESVTLPQRFDLDALDLDEDIFAEGSPDNHLRSREEITLIDQIPIGRDAYVAISFDDDIGMLPTEEIPSPMQEDILSPPSVDRDPGFQETSVRYDAAQINETDAFQNSLQSDRTNVLTVAMDSGNTDSSNQTEFIDLGVIDDENPPDVEVMRSVIPDLSSTDIPPVSPEHQSHITDPDRFTDHATTEKEILSPILEETLASAGQSLPFQQPASAASQEAPDVFDTHVSFGLKSPDLALRSSPQVQQPQRRPRKRKHFFDESTVLTNKFMKTALEGCHDLLRKRRETPSSALGVWKLKNNLRKEQVFLQPLITGLCADICNLYEKGSISSKPHLTLEPVATECMDERSPAQSSEAIQEPAITSSLDPAFEASLGHRNAASPATANVDFPEPTNAVCSIRVTGTILEPFIAECPGVEPESNIEIERLRHDEAHLGNDILPELFPSEERLMRSPIRRNDFTPDLANNIGSQTATWAESTVGTGLLPTPDIGTSTGTFSSELETPKTYLEERMGIDNTELSDIPEMMNSAETEELYFLEADNTPTGSRFAQGIESLSVRTRAVAQYLRSHSPVMGMSENQPEDLSLNKILEGKTRKLSARMFFETLVSL